MMPMSETHDTLAGTIQSDAVKVNLQAFQRSFFRVAPSMFLGSLDQTIVAAALPVMAASLGGLSYISWVITAYLLAATISAPIYGRMGDAYGRRHMLLWSLGLFLLGSIACAVAPNLSLLAVARGLQGFGGGGLMTLSQAVLGETVSPKERGRFQGWFGAIFALASTLGPVAGGFFAEHYGWRTIFWMNVPLALIATATAFRLKASQGTGICTLDHSGSFLFVSATVSLLLCLSLGGDVFPWLSALPITLFLASVAGFLLLARVETRFSDPLISPALMEKSMIWRPVLTVLLFASVLFGLIVQLPLFLQATLHISPTASGLMLIPLTLAQVVVSTFTGLHIAKTGKPKAIMANGLLCVAIGFAILTLFIRSGPLPVSLLTLLIGAGLGTTMPAAQTIVQWAAGTEKLGVATAALSFSRSIGGVIGAAITSAVIFGVLHSSNGSSSLLSSSLTVAETNQVLTAFRCMFLALCVLSAMAATLAYSLSQIDLATAPPE